MTNTTVSFVYGLLIGKSTDNYNLFFEKALKQDNLQPESIMIDFEIGTMKSVREGTRGFCIKLCSLLLIKINSWILPWEVYHKKHKGLRKCFQLSKLVELFLLIILIKKIFSFHQKITTLGSKY